MIWIIDKYYSDTDSQSHYIVKGHRRQVIKHLLSVIEIDKEFYEDNYNIEAEYATITEESLTLSPNGKLINGKIIFKDFQCYYEAQLQNLSSICFLDNNGNVVREEF